MMNSDEIFWLTPYWVTFDWEKAEQSFSSYKLVQIGCGVTAYGWKDAQSILSTELFKDDPIPPIEFAIESIGIGDLNEQVRPHIGYFDKRGIWFPYFNKVI
jgi:hypothetical protein